MLVMLLLEVIQLFADAFEALHGELGLIMRGRRVRDGLGNSFQVVKEGVWVLACAGRAGNDALEDHENAGEGV
jgi:hypothetical protein